jgi:hypothetical protein
VPVALGVSAVQPLLAALTGEVTMDWALQLAGPGLLGAGAMMAIGRMTDRPGDFTPPWYSAWALLPGAFLLAGAASMCIFGAFVQLGQARVLEWALLVAGTPVWAAALTWVRRAAR